MDQQEIIAMDNFRKYAQDINENDNITSIKRDDNLTNLIIHGYVALHGQRLKTPAQIISILLKYVFDIAYDYLHCCDSQIDKLMDKKDRYIIPYILNDDVPNPFCYEGDGYIICSKAYNLNKDCNDWQCNYCGEINKYYHYYCVECLRSNPCLYHPMYQWELYIHDLASNGKIDISIYAENKIEFQPLWSYIVYSYGIKIINKKIHTYRYCLDTTVCVDDYRPDYKLIECESNLCTGDTILIAIKHNKCLTIIKDNNGTNKQIQEWGIPPLKYQLIIKTCPKSYANTRIELANFSQIQ